MSSIHVWECHFTEQVCSIRTISCRPALLTPCVTTVTLASSLEWHKSTRGHTRGPERRRERADATPPEEESGRGTFSRQSRSPQNKLALFLQLKCCKDVPWGKRINSTWPSDLITTHSTAALLRPRARRWGARLGSSVERQAVEKTCGCIIYKRRQPFRLQTLSPWCRSSWRIQCCQSSITPTVTSTM